MNSKNIRYGTKAKKQKTEKPYKFGRKLLRQLIACGAVFVLCIPISRSETAMKAYISNVLINSSDIEGAKLHLNELCKNLEAKNPYLADNIMWSGLIELTAPQNVPEPAPSPEQPQTPEEALELVVKAAPEEYVYPESVDLRAPLTGEITSPFGGREHPVLGTDGIHHGTDVAGEFGAPIISCAPGKVLTVKTDDTYGNCLLIQHTGSMKSFYAHCDEIKVIEGELVDGNTLIATVGSTGISTGPHLHFELRIDDEAVNSADYIDWGMF